MTLPLKKQKTNTENLDSFTARCRSQHCKTTPHVSAGQTLTMLNTHLNSLQSKLVKATKNVKYEIPF